MDQQPQKYTVETPDNAWSYIVGPDGYRECYRYRWEAEEFAEQLNNGTLRPYQQRRV